MITVTRFGWILTTFGPIVCHAIKLPCRNAVSHVSLSLVSAFLLTSGTQNLLHHYNTVVNKKRHFVVSESGRTKHNDAACRQRGLCCSSISHLVGEVQHEVTLNLHVAGCQWAAPEISKMVTTIL